MINTIFWIACGGLLGWVASMTMNKDVQQSTMMNIGVGIVGALVAGGLITPILGIADVTRNNFSTVALGISLIGAVIGLIILNIFRQIPLEKVLQKIMDND